MLRTRGSSIGPSLAAIGNTLYAMWVGATGPELWYASIDNPSNPDSRWTDHMPGPGKTGQDKVPPPRGASLAIPTTFFTATANH